MMTCRELAELLIDFLSGELPPDEEVRIRQHLERCPPCVTYLETYKLVIILSRRLPCAPMPPQMVQRLHAALHQVGREQPPSGDCAQP
jgi:anti-sigma factor RsiW